MVREIRSEVSTEPVARGTTRKGRQTRARIIQIGAEVLGERGYFDSRVVEIAERSNVALGTFYRYFPNKEALFLLILENVTSELLGSTNGVWSSSDTEGSLHEVTVAYLTRFYEDRGVIAALLQMAAQVPEAMKLWTQLRRKLHGRMEKYMRQTEVGRQYSHPDLLSSALGLMVEQSAIHWFIELPSAGEVGPTVADAADALSLLWYRSVYGSVAVPYVGVHRDRVQPRGRLDCHKR